MRRRAVLAATVVWSSVLWRAQTWNLTKVQRAKLDSWGARVFARMQGSRRGTLEDVGAWWRERHRRGHALVRKFSSTLSSQSQRLVHKWAGHIARMKADHWLAGAVRCRSIQWWRWRQERHTCKWSGVHPQRFKASRWEGQLAALHGDGCAEHVWDNSGWWAHAQDRHAWRESGEHPPHV